MHTFRPNPNFTRSSCSSLRVSVKGGLNEVLNVFQGLNPMVGLGLGLEEDGLGLGLGVLS